MRIKIGPHDGFSLVTRVLVMEFPYSTELHDGVATVRLLALVCCMFATTSCNLLDLKL